MYKKDLKALTDKIAADDLEDAEELVKEMHAKYNDQPLAHARIHFTWANIASLRRDYMHALGHMVAGIVFAIPVSLFKRIKSY